MLEKTYRPAEVEEKHYRLWEDSGAFAAKAGSNGKPYTIMMPPPNVTGSLHMGHALTFTLQDVLTRYNRMRGRDALWQPGTDHAGIATQMVVERNLAKEGKTRHDFGRDAFIDKVWEWKAESGGTITRQLRRLGASPDWPRERFTMDEGLSRAVRKVFVELHKQGLIYKDKRLVNWDPKLHTAISDLEVEQKEIKGNLWHFRYPIDGEEGRYIVVATTRPETMLGDTGVAVHPEDERYKDLIGKMVRLPLVGRLIPIVGDEYADPETGSGAVKITPAHDFNDFEVGKRCGLEQINIMDRDARLNDNVPEAYRGLDRYEARKRIVADLEALELLEKIEPHTHMVPHGDRSGVAIEPWLTDQWYVDAATLAKPAIEAVETGKTVFVPKQWENTYFEWMRNIQPWCISRQIWWGHQIPAWYGPDGAFFVEETEEEARAAALKHYGKDVELTRDADVLDTWFSSALWPFSTLGWPDQTPELERYYPTDVLVTGFDIIFFWVARMMMMGLHFMEKVPFETVFLHAMVRDEKGEKMSKTKGNVIDPLDVTAKYGADALRFTLAAMTAQGRDIKLALDRVAGYKAFANKIWNAARFSLLHMSAVDTSKPLDESRISDADRWILTRFHRAAADVIAALEAFRFNDAASRVYQFVWRELCDWYIELVKPRLYEGSPEEKAASARVLRDVLDGSLRLLHPMMPFVTEEIWQKLPRLPGDPDSIMIASYPTPDPDRMQDAEADRFDALIEIVQAVRSLRVDLSVPESAEVDLHFAADAGTGAWLRERAAWLQRLAKVKRFVPKEEAWPEDSPAVLVRGVELRLPIGGLVDRDELLAKLRKEADKLAVDVDRIEKRLGNPGFTAKAPPEVIEKDRALAEEMGARLAKVRDNLARISKG